MSTGIAVDRLDRVEWDTDFSASNGRNSHGFSTLCWVSDGLGPLYDFCGVILGRFGCRGHSFLGIVGVVVELVLVLLSVLDMRGDEDIAGSDPPRKDRDDGMIKANG